nr:ORF [Arabidopsis thaliana]AAA32733.1 ORF [Arabidopsis thaliana]
MFLCVCI